MKVFIGYDNREASAARVAARSLRRVALGQPFEFLKVDRLAEAGLLRRPTDMRGGIYDLPSNAPCATQFAISRFLTPILGMQGWALFVDCDVVFLDDPLRLLDQVEPGKAVHVVQHPDLTDTASKMDGQPQQPYPRKNWSSVMLFDCGHPANARLTLQDVNERPGRDLHRFYWLADSEIGALPPEWNWLVNVQPKPENPKIAHFTQGGPWLPNWKGAPHDDIWNEAAQ